MPDDSPVPSQLKTGKPVSWRVAMLCVVLGLICMAFPFVGDWIAPKLFSTKAYLLSLSMAFGLFLTAVGGWASGKWRGWTFGGAAATVVALFLLINFVGDRTDAIPEKAVVAKIIGSDEPLFSEITRVEVEEESGTRLFVAPNRRLNHVDVLIEASNLDTDCLAFVFAPVHRPGSAEGDVEPITIKVPSGFFSQALDAAEDQANLRHRMRIYYHHLSGALMRKPPTPGEPPEWISGPGICSDFTAVHHDNDRRRLGPLGWISAVFAADFSDQDLIRQLNSEDALTRRDAREQIAGRGPQILPALMAEISDPATPDHYRYALGTVVALAQMVPAGFDSAKIHAVLSEADLERVVGLMAYPDETMRKWATAAVVRLGDERTVRPLIDILGDDSTSLDGKYNAAFALRETAPGYPELMQRKIVDETNPLKTTLGPRTTLLLDQLPTSDVDAIKTGWVYLGAHFGKGWSERYFSWSGDSLEAPAIGTDIDATGNVNLRADHIRFTWTEGWQNSEIVGLVEKGQSVTVRNVKEVTPGFFWAQIKLNP